MARYQLGCLQGGEQRCERRTQAQQVDACAAACMADQLCDVQHKAEH